MSIITQLRCPVEPYTGCRGQADESADNSSSGVSVQQSVGSSTGRDTCVPEQALVNSQALMFLFSRVWS